MNPSRSGSGDITRRWRFAMDVGGTFTDVVAVAPDGRTHVHKILSSGRVRGIVADSSNGRRVFDPRRRNEPPNLWRGYQLTLLSHVADRSFETKVIHSDSESGLLELRDALPSHFVGSAYELFSHEPAPIVAVRCLVGLPLDLPIGNVELRLGTTRATNALLERKGARVVLATTRGFADVLTIGYQDRPKLFELNIRKREELAEYVVEIDERLAADGSSLREPDPNAVRRQLQDVRRGGVDSLAICLLHAHVNPAHEILVAAIAESVGFRHVSVSHRVARREGFVSRGDTTVVDAYLSPVVTEYVRSLRTSLPEAQLTLMTSNGGLVRAEHASGKDTILSGPAGGVVGCARVARDLGYDRVIGFDMGGTSTDVCRIDGPFEYQHETVKAGVRMMAPMLAVETVAAGGGSICGFDGHHLFVGPQSAGSDPGPACYGHGGPLTITDINVLLGRISPACFPFELDTAAARSQLGIIRDQLRRDTEAGLSDYELAEGFLRIANEKMAAAIRQVSTSRGYDVRDYALLSFGGAGGQHACAIATILGMKTMIHSPFAGVLSAVGIASATISRIAERSVKYRLSEADRSALESCKEVLTREATARLVEDGVDQSLIGAPECTLDLCYADQATFIPLVADPWTSLAERFADAHQRLYGYRHEGRAIEIRTVRVKVEAVRDEHPSLADNFGNRSVAPSAHGCTKMICRDAGKEVPLFRRANLTNGQTIHGPAILAEETSTLVIDAGWLATVIGDGSLIVEAAGEARRGDKRDSAFDPVQLELFRARFSAIAERMGATLRRTALSTNVKDRLDFSCAVFTAKGDLIANAPHIPVHLGGMSLCVKALREDVGAFRRGDVYVTNDPFRGGSHLNDVTVVTPVFGEGEDLLFIVASRAHHAEIGGRRPGSMGPDSTSLADEGVLIRAFKYVDRGQLRARELRERLTTARYPSRAPEENLADISAQVAANETGAQDMMSLVSMHGTEVVHAYVGYMRESAARQIRMALSKRPPGVRRFEDFMDDGTRISVTMTLGHNRVICDFTGTSPIHPGNLNANTAIVTSAVLYCLRCLMNEDIPLNEGVLDAVRIIVPECFLNPRPSDDPSMCPPVAAGNVETSQRIVDAVFGALGVVAASQGTMNNVLIGNSRFGYYETICGGAGAGDGFDGADAVHTHMTNTRLTDAEILESRYPVRVVRFEIRGGSGGRGSFRGGNGVVRELEFLEPLDVSLISQRRSRGPYGLSGGEPGAPGRNTLRRAGATNVEVLPSIVQFQVGPGDRLTIETPGGGGYGAP